MVIKDRVYGEIEVSSGVLQELISSGVVQRLKGIAQHGVPDEYYSVPGFSRFDHCVGVMLLLKKLGASEEEQIAGLLHDVSHTAFSHMIDWVVGSGATEDYQDEQHSEYIMHSEIPAILHKYGYSADRVTDYHHFGLLERDLPDLCADRVDYSLRELPADIIALCEPSLVAYEGRIAFNSKGAASLFAKNFLGLQHVVWAGPETSARCRVFADILRLAVKENIVTMDDFWQDDRYVINKLLASQNERILSALQVMKLPSVVHHLGVENVTTDFKKFRYVDPLILDGEQLVRLSEVDDAFAAELERARADNEAGIKVPFLPSLL